MQKALGYLVKNQFIAAILFLIAGYFLIQIRGILALVFASYIIMSALYPTVRALRKRKVPNFLAVIISYSILLGIVSLIVVPIIPFFASQIDSLIENFPSFTRKAALVFNIQISAGQISSLLTSVFSSIGRSAFAFTGQVLGGFFSVLAVVVISFYLMLDYDRFKQSLMHLFPKKMHNAVYETLILTENKLGSWLRGQLLLSGAVGLLTGLVLYFLGVDFALPLALLAAILEIVPTIGPILAAVPAIIVALTISPLMALIVAGAYLAIQMLENNLLVPKIMQSAVGLNPIIVILAIIIGANLMGVVGALLAVPFVSFLIIIFGVKEFNPYLKDKKESEK